MSKVNKRLRAIAFVAGVVFSAAWSTPQAQGQPAATSAPTSANSLSDIAVERSADGRWMAKFTYAWDGAAPPGLIRIELAPGGPAAPMMGQSRMPGVARAGGVPDPASAFMPAQPGRHQASVEITRPVHTRAALVTTEMTIELRSRDQVLVRQRLDQRIEWPDLDSWFFDRQWAGKTNDDILHAAIYNINAVQDAGALREARKLLERVLQRDPKCDQCHLEFARIAMKSNWGPEGLRQAESYIASARQIKPDSANAKILLGYVYVHQGRLADAEFLFADAARSDPPNNWLWANWGELLLKQRKLELAIAKYREALRRPAVGIPFDYARLEAFDRLLTIYEQRQNIAGVGELLKQRSEESSPGSCDAESYARFLILRVGDAALARQVMDREMTMGCTLDSARQVLGLAYYVDWSKSSDPPKDELLHKARVYFPPSVTLVELLASSDKTLGTLRLLIKRGEAVDQVDNQGVNALARAVDHGDGETVMRLLQVGASPQARVGAAAVPVALLPVLAGNVDMIRLFRRAGVDYAKVQFQGGTAIEIARKTGDRRIIDALGLSL
jgi:tetratricopeptide (TPR) repeat protein